MLLEMYDERHSSQVSRRIKALQLMLLLLPPPNFALFRALSLLLHSIALQRHHNKMSPCNLGMVFAPHILCPRKVSFLHGKSRKSFLRKKVSSVSCTKKVKKVSCGKKIRQFLACKKRRHENGSRNKIIKAIINNN